MPLPLVQLLLRGGPLLLGLQLLPLLGQRGPLGVEFGRGLIELPLLIGQPLLRRGRPLLRVEPRNLPLLGLLLEIGLPFLDSRRAARVDPAAIDCPLLVIGTAKDRLTPASTVRKVARRYARASAYKEFAGQGHWVLGQPGWQDVAAYTADWLERMPLAVRDVAAPAAEGAWRSSISPA